MSVQPGTDRVPAQVRAAVVLVGLQGLAFAGGAVVLVVKTAVGHPDSVARALLGAAFALLGAVVLGACARGLLGLRAAARTPHNVRLLYVGIAEVPTDLCLPAGLDWVRLGRGRDL